MAVLAAGVVSAFQIAKLPASLPVLRDGLGLGLVAAGWVISTISVVGVVTGMASGWISDRIGHRRAPLCEHRPPGRGGRVLRVSACGHRGRCVDLCLFGQTLQQTARAGLLCGERLAQAQHQACVDDVLAGCPPMGVLRMIWRLHGRAKGYDKCRHAHPVLPRIKGQARWVNLHLKAGAVDECGADFGDHTLRTLDLGQSAFDKQHRAQFGTVGPKPADLSGGK